MLDADMCEGISTPDEMKKLCISNQSEIVEQMLEKYRNEILEVKTPTINPTNNIKVGQNESVKSM